MAWAGIVVRNSKAVTSRSARIILHPPSVHFCNRGRARPTSSASSGTPRSSWRVAPTDGGFRQVTRPRWTGLD